MSMISKVLSQVIITEDDISNLPTNENPNPQVSDIMSWIFILVVAVATIVVIIAGISFITSQGDPQKAKNARSAIIYAFVGIIIAALATSIVRFVAERVV